MWFGVLIDVASVNIESPIADAVLKLLKHQVNLDINRYCKTDGSISGDAVIEDCFPNIAADVFISHSHNDERYARKFASYLYNELHLMPFLDSCVWGSADSLLKKIDNKFCLNLSHDTYNYSARNLSTSYVHMMLISAICNMIDKCPLFVFLQSKNSVNISDIQNKKTFSPWIFMELLLAHKTRIRIPKQRKSFSAQVVDEAAENLNIEFWAQTEALKTLSQPGLINWAKRCKIENATSAEEKVALLYQMLTHSNF